MKREKTRATSVLGVLSRDTRTAPGHELYVMVDVGMVSQMDRASGWSAVHAVAVQVSH